MLAFLIIGLIVALGMYNGYVMRCDKDEDEIACYKGVSQSINLITIVAFTCLSLIVFSYTKSYALVFFSLATFLVFYDGVIHILGMRKPFFYVSNVLLSDKLIRALFGRKDGSLDTEITMYRNSTIVKVLFFFYMFLLALGK